MAFFAMNGPAEGDLAFENFVEEVEENRVFAYEVERPPTRQSVLVHQTVANC